LSRGQRRSLLLLLAGFATLLSAQEAKPPPQKPAASKPAAAPTTVDDDEFLEFLGSVDSDSADSEWMEYLAQSDIVRVARTKKETPVATEVKK
jgi:hypothetical protein